MKLERKDTRPVLLIAGGFLGAGKTTLLIKAAELLRESGLRAGIITNDQGGDLVDTRLARAAGTQTEEIAGGCFCCRYSEFVRAAGRIAADVILAEAVGSCTDLAATVVQGVRRFHPEIAVGPLTVVVDPARAAELMAPDADPDMAFLFRQQIAEADIVCFTRADVSTGFPDLSARRLSGVTGEGVAAWLEEALAYAGPAGEHLLEIDYERYAQAEAALGWLNWRFELRCAKPLTPAGVVGRLLEGFGAGSLNVVHLKVMSTAGGAFVKASVCGQGREPLLDGRLDTPPATKHEVVINLRAIGEPEALENAAQRAAGALPGRVKMLHREAFRPAPPHPEWRVDTR